MRFRSNPSNQTVTPGEMGPVHEQSASHRTNCGANGTRMVGMVDGLTTEKTGGFYHGNAGIDQKKKMNLIEFVSWRRPQSPIWGKIMEIIMKTSENDSLTVYRIWIDYWGFQMIKNPMAMCRMV